MAEATPGILIDPVSIQGDYQVTFNGSNMGLVDTVDPTGIKILTKPIVTGSTGKDNPIGHRVVGFAGIIKVTFRQITLAMQQALASWSTGTPVQLIPPLNSDMYDFARTLNLHPDERGTDTTMDIVIPLATCMTVPLVKRDGGTPDELTVDFQCYMTRSNFNASFGAITPGTIKGE